MNLTELRVRRQADGVDGYGSLLADRVMRSNNSSCRRKKSRCWLLAKSPELIRPARGTSVVHMFGGISDCSRRA